MERVAKPIGVVQGASSDLIQALFDEFVRQHRPALRIAGVIEQPAGRASGCEPERLLSLTDGRDFALYQELGEASVSCALDAESLIAVGQRVCEDICAGCDLVVLSKFGKLEAENRSGLIPAFAAALERGIPVLTSVSPKYADAWSAFAEPMFNTLAPEMAALEAWWGSQGHSL